jgi:hypothetical protein
MEVVAKSRGKRLDHGKRWRRTTDLVEATARLMSDSLMKESRQGEQGDRGEKDDEC